MQEKRRREERGVDNTYRVAHQIPFKSTKALLPLLKNSGKRSFKLNHSNWMLQSDTRIFASCWKSLEERRQAISLWPNSSKKWCRTRRLVMLDNHGDGDNKKKNQKKTKVLSRLVRWVHGLASHVKQRSIEPRNLSVSTHQAAIQLEVRCLQAFYIVDLFLVLVVIFAGRQL